MNNKNIISAANDMTLKLKVLAKEEKESVRRKLAVTAETLRIKAKQLATIAKEKESARLKLAVTAKEKERVRNKLESNRACRNGLWAWNVLMLSNETFLFCNRTGLSVFGQNKGILVDPIEYDYVSGWFTDLDELVTRFNIQLENKGDIFVPFVNESLVPFKEQSLHRKMKQFVHHLVYEQMPAEIQPID